MLLVGGVAMLVVAISLFGARGQRSHAPATRAYLRMCRALAREGLERRPGEGPIDYCRRVSLARPELAAPVRAMTDDFLALGYAGASTDLLLARLRKAAVRFSAGRAFSLTTTSRNSTV
jgi:hypothetical protein